MEIPDNNNQMREKARNAVTVVMAVTIVVMAFIIVAVVASDEPPNSEGYSELEILGMQHEFVQLCNYTRNLVNRLDVFERTFESQMRQQLPDFRPVAKWQWEEEYTLIHSCEAREKRYYGDE